MKLITLGLLASVGIMNADTDFKIIDSFKCARNIPGANELISQKDSLQASAENELQQIGKEFKKITEELQKDYNDLMGLQATAKADSPDLKRARAKVEEKQAKAQELQAKGQRIMQEAQAEIQAIEMRLQPYISQVLQNTLELASKTPNINIYDEYTHQFIYKSPSSDFNSEVVKLTEKKNEQKTVIASKAKTPATKVA